jgi:peptidoglycan hydrolase CwlO-like protein
MANLLSVTAKILPLIAVAIKLADGTNVADKSVSTYREAADGLKILGDDLKGFEKQILQINANIGGLMNKAKGRGFKKLLRE